MTRQQAANLCVGDKLMSPYSANAYEPLRVAEVATLKSGQTMVRIPKLSSVSQMSGGWCSAESFILAPKNFRWDARLGQYYKLAKDKSVVAVVSRLECQRMWRERVEGQ